MEQELDMDSHEDGHRHLALLTPTKNCDVFS